MIRKPDWLSKKNQSLQVRVRQQLYKGKTNSPFLSGDSFASVCDYSFGASVQNSNTNLEVAKSIFCKSDVLEEFLETNWDKILAKVLVLGNSDRDFYEPPCDFPSSLQSVYLQNSHISDHFFKTLPIGLENLRHGRNGMPSLFDFPAPPIEKKEIILVGPFSPTHTERRELDVWNKIQHPQIKVISERLHPRALSNEATQFKYVACPRGNGTDTHRFWETLYRGSIPVVKRNRWSESILSLGIPMIQLSSWDFEEFLHISSQYSYLKLNPKRIHELWMDHWERVFNL
jgi:hypothetical protein